MAFFVTYLVDEVNGGIRASLPDFNLYTFASAVSEVPDRLREAIAAGYHGKEPKSSGLDDLKDDPRYQGGWWLWLNIDVDDLAARRRSWKTVSHKRSSGPGRRGGARSGAARSA
ncbi:hypothetical protein [Aquabacterium sp.]|uniref:hypothetical protein n=1 Tax=Aquabacterium sp. TaxID=1872578 RepID=UPI0035AF19EA